MSGVKDRTVRNSTSAQRNSSVPVVRRGVRNRRQVNYCELSEEEDSPTPSPPSSPSTTTTVIPPPLPTSSVTSTHNTSNGNQSTLIPPTPPPTIPPPLNTTTVTMSIPQAVLDALDDTQKAALEAWARCHTAPVINIPTVKVKQLNHNVKPPQYDSRKQNSTSYLDELEAYFKHQGFEIGEYVDVLPTVLPEHMKSWLRNKKVVGYNWGKFRADFAARFDSTSDKSRRQHYLATRKQRDDEPIESFIWEMMDLAKQVYPTEDEATSVQRCREALVPRLKLALGELSNPTA